MGHSIELNRDTRTLTVELRSVRLSPLQTRYMGALLDAYPHPVPARALIEALWPGPDGRLSPKTASLKAHGQNLRLKFGDRGLPLGIDYVPRRGRRLVLTEAA
jgi:DNA-binding winged-HTH domains